MTPWQIRLRQVRRSARYPVKDRGRHLAKVRTLGAPCRVNFHAIRFDSFRCMFIARVNWLALSVIRFGVVSVAEASLAASVLLTNG
jgi:hypothetical protein